MKCLLSRLKSRAILTTALFVTMLSVSAFSHAAMLRVTIENNAQANGLSFTPLYVAFHSAAFDVFNTGDTASAGVKAIAELGQAGTLRDERLAVDANSQGGLLFPDGGMRPLFPGESGSRLFEIADPMSNMFFSFISMILPSNDTFFGNDDAVQLFDSSGNFIANRVFEITGADLYDAGTEALDVLAAPFVQGSTATNNPTDMNTSIRAAESLAAFAGLTLANGSVLDAALIDFINNPDLSIATIRVEEVPAPSAFALILLISAGLFAKRRYQV